jgi:hypothetical protein
MSCHVEHHDLPRVPWMHLMTVKKIAPEFYDRLFAHSGYWTILFQYLFDSNLALTSRITRPTKRKDDGVAIDDNTDMLEVEAQDIPVAFESKIVAEPKKVEIVEESTQAEVTVDEANEAEAEVGVVEAATEPVVAVVEAPAVEEEAPSAEPVEELILHSNEDTTVAAEEDVAMDGTIEEDESKKEQ